MCFLRFNKYNVKHIAVVINGYVWENQGRTQKNNFLNQTYWIHLGQFGLDSNFHNYYNLNCELIP